MAFGYPAVYLLYDLELCLDFRPSTAELPSWGSHIWVDQFDKHSANS